MKAPIPWRRGAGLRGILASALALAVILLPAVGAPAEAVAVPTPGLARQLLEGCLKPPRLEGVAQLAQSVGAEPYSEARRRRKVETSTVNYPEPGTGRDQRTTTTTTEFRGWDLPGPAAGRLEYRERDARIVWVDRASGEVVTPVRVTRSRSCTIRAPVANARAIFETHETLTEHPYGIRIAADRRWIDMFMFDPDRFDIELVFEFNGPLANLAPDASRDEGWLILPDGGPRLMTDPHPEIPTVELTRAALLAGLDQPASMTFFNIEIQPVVQRLAVDASR